MAQDDEADAHWSAVFWAPSYACFMAAPATLCWQIYGWLRSGEWVSLSVVDALARCGVDWAQSPQDWIGVWRILSHIHVAFLLVGAGFAFISLARPLVARFGEGETDHKKR